MRHIFPFLLIIFGFQTSIGFSQDIWTTREAVTSIQLHQPIFDDLGIRILARDITATPLPPEREAFAGRAGSPLSFSVQDGRMGAFNAGSLQHFGGYRFQIKDQTWNLDGFIIRVAQPPYTFELVDQTGMSWFLLTHAHPHLRPQESTLILRNMDLEMTQELALVLDRTDLEGQFMGTANIAFSIDIPVNTIIPKGCVPDFTGDVDVVLSSLSNLSQGAREAGGRLALSVSASLRNDGTADVPWFRSIAPDGGVPPGEIGQHPYLVLHIYQLRNGVFRQIAQSDVKHAFFSINSICACPGGQVLFVGCGDTYGAGTNLNRLYLAPREEVTANSGDWTSLGSHFDATPVDDFRHHAGFGEHDNFEHRMVVQNETILAEPGSRYFVEAWYLVKGDINIFNSMGFREFSPTLIGSVWSFSFLGLTLTLGPALDAWVDPNALNPGEANASLDTGKGKLRLGVQTQDLGSNTFRFEYALMNLDFDSQIQSFRMPIPPNTIILDPTFLDRDTEPLNDWQVTISADAVVWQAPAGNSLDWGTMFNFGFSANGGPGAEQAVLNQLEGGPTPLTIDSLGPTNPCLPFNFFVDGLPDWPAQANIQDLMARMTLICP